MTTEKRTAYRDPDVLRAQDVAKLLGIAVKTVYSSTQIPRREIHQEGKRPIYLYSKSAILAWLKGQAA